MLISLLAPDGQEFGIEVKGCRMVEMTVVVKVRPEKEEEFLQAMRSLTSARERREGPGAPVLYKAVDDQYNFKLTWEWETQVEMEKYTQTEQFRVLLGAVKVLGEKSEVWHSQVSGKEVVL